MKTEKQILIILIIGVILTLVSPYFLTRSAGLIDFSNTGSIGDTIGGITSPIVSLIGSLLVYYALKAQIDANAIIQQQLNDQKVAEYDRKIVTYLSEQLNMIRTDINDLEFVESTEKVINGEKTKVSTTFRGSEAVNKYLELYKLYETEGNEVLFVEVYQLEQLKLLLELINNFLNLILKEKISSEDKDYLLYNLTYIYKSKVKPHLDFHEEDDSPDVIYSIARLINDKMQL